MKRILIVATLVGGLVLGGAPAHAEDPSPRLVSPVVCVQGDFPLLHSGWQIRQAVEEWNTAQTAVRFTLRWEPGCSVVRLHRYDERDNRAGYTDYFGLAPWSLVNVYLNEAYRASALKCATRYLVVHELGHALGLVEHTIGRTSVMSYGYDIQRFCGQPSIADVAAVVALYSAP